MPLSPVSHTRYVAGDLITTVLWPEEPQPDGARDVMLILTIDMARPTLHFRPLGGALVELWGVGDLREYPDGDHPCMWDDEEEPIVCLEDEIGVEQEYLESNVRRIRLYRKQFPLTEGNAA